MTNPVPENGTGILRAAAPPRDAAELMLVPATANGTGSVKFDAVGADGNQKRIAVAPPFLLVDVPLPVVIAEEEYRSTLQRKPATPGGRIRNVGDHRSAPVFAVGGKGDPLAIASGVVAQQQNKASVGGTPDNRFTETAFPGILPERVGNVISAVRFPESGDTIRRPDEREQQIIREFPRIIRENRAETTVRQNLPIDMRNRPINRLVAFRSENR